MSDGSSGNESSRSSKRARLAATIIILALFAFSIIIVYEANYLNWPFSSQGRGGNSRSTQSSSSVSPPNASLEVSVSTTNNGVRTQLGGAGIQIYSGTAIIGPDIASGSTNFPDGVVFFSLAPAQYTVKISTILLDFQPITISTYNSTTTQIYANINLTSYNATFFDIVNPDATDELPPWGSIFLQVYSNSILSPATNIVYLVFTPTPSGSTTTTTNSLSGQKSNMTNVNSSTFELPGTFAITILSQVLSPKDGTLRIQLKLDSIVNVSAVKEISILTIGTSYDLQYSPPLANATSSLTISTASQEPSIICTTPGITCPITNTTQ